MFSAKKRLLEKLMRNYDSVFAFIERVMVSCKTEKQLENAFRWAENYCRQREEAVAANDSVSHYFTIARYFSAKFDMINEHYLRKKKEFLENEIWQKFRII